jgi:RNA recognition motif-containing protein
MKNKKVYVGNIPYNTSETEIKELLSIVGPV